MSKEVSNPIAKAGIGIMVFGLVIGVIGIILGLTGITIEASTTVTPFTDELNALMNAGLVVMFGFIVLGAMVACSGAFWAVQGDL